MIAPITSARARSRNRRRSSRSKPAALAPAPPDSPLLRTRYRELTLRHLGTFLNRLFAEFTGLHFHIAWAPPPTHDWNAHTMPTGCSVCCRLAGANAGTRRYCRSCGPKQLDRTLSADGGGHRFICRLRVHNHWFPIRVRGVTVGIAYLQALAFPGRERSGSKRRVLAGARESSRSEFRRAGRLLRLIVQHVQILDLAELRQMDLTNARQAVTALASEQARLRKELDRDVPVAAGPRALSASESRAEQIVRGLLEQTQRNYAQPLTLRRLAVSLAMNAAYLSALFSRAVGIPFKTYLTEMRLEKARQLLGDPARSISGIAGSVGYASENRFRSAFKKFSGLSPKAWRETFRAVKVVFLCGLLEELACVQSVEALFL